jgi:hypothetical protein
MPLLTPKADCATVDYPANDTSENELGTPGSIEDIQRCFPWSCMYKTKSRIKVGRDPRRESPENISRVVSIDSNSYPDS